MDAASCSGKYSQFKGFFDPCQRKNILYNQEFLGWQERIINKLCVVYDPHNILVELFIDKEISLHYIEELEDLEAIREAINETSEGETLVLNFGSNVHIISGINISDENPIFSRIDSKISKLFRFYKKNLKTDYCWVSSLS